jgi:type II restriction/modification system DNA methylase subunit YeeA
LRRVGLVATNSIRGGANRRVLDRIVRDGVIFDAWDDEPWVLDGVAVRVSLICFAKEPQLAGVCLDGRAVQRINSDLTAAIDLTSARPLAENAGVAFSGISKKGRFEVPGELVRQWLQLPVNPNGRPNADVLFPWWNGDDLTGGNRDYWIIHFDEKSVTDAAYYEKPFADIEQVVRPFRSRSRSALERNHWWKTRSARQQCFPPFDHFKDLL